jgi:RimJ/RimL family protein N-acetyltransferase
MALPDTIQAEELELRRWDCSFVGEMVDVVAFSLPELERWMPWAQGAPRADEMRMVFSKGRSDFEEGKAWNYGLFERMSGDLVGSAGLHREDDRACPEIGYWVRTDRTRRGFATCAARALAETAFMCLPDVEQVKICVDRANLASASVPKRLGFRLTREEAQPIEAKAHTGKVEVWILGRCDPVGVRD